MLILLLICAIYIPHLLRTIEYDEAATLLEFARSPFIALFVYSSPNNHLLHSFLVWLSTSLLGDSVLALRFTAFAASVLSFALIYRLGLRLGNHRTGIFALVLMAAMPLFINYIPTARGYSLSVLLTLLVFDSLYGENPSGAHKRHRLMLLSALLMLTLPTMILLILPLAGWIWLHHRPHLRRAYLPAMLFGAAAGIIFYFYGFFSGGFGSFSSLYGYPSVLLLAEQIRREFLTGTLAPILTFGLLIGAGFAWKSSRPFLSAVGWILAAAALLAVAQQWILGSVLYPRNYLYITPFIALLAAFGLSRIRLNLRVDRFVMVMLCGVILSAAFVDAYRLGRPNQIDTFQKAVETHARSTDFILAGCCLDYPGYYLFRDTELFKKRDSAERIVIFPTVYETFEKLQKEIPRLSNCQSDIWEGLEVHLCPVDGLYSSEDSSP